LFIEGKENEKNEEIFLLMCFRDMAYARFLMKYPAIGKVRIEEKRKGEFFLFD
jgi:hypothetical protein